MENYLQNKEVILSVKDLSVCFSLRGKSLHAIRGVSLDVYKGESPCHSWRVRLRQVGTDQEFHRPT